MTAEHPDLLQVESIGRSHEGRDLWLATVTDRATGPHDAKPAQWVDANIHATELTGSVAALHLLHRLVTGFGADETVTRALRTRTFYVVPRVNPDGAELALADRPRLLRSSVRRWPWQDGHVPPGLDEGDVDGDGRILTMRIPDPNGAWRPHPDEPRLLHASPPRRARRRRLLPAPARGMAAGPRRLHHPDAPDARRPRPQPQLPGRLGSGGARAGRLPGLGAGDPGAHGRRRSRGPTCAATTPTTRRAASSCGRRRPVPTGSCPRSTSGRGPSSAGGAPS